MLKEFEERIQNAKDKQFKMLERFHIGDAVYPFWLENLVVYGIVTDVDTVARKVYCDFNGVSRQFCPEDLMHVNPELINASAAKKRNASAKLNKKGYEWYVVLDDGKIESGWECKEDAEDRMNELKEDGVLSKVRSGRGLDADNDANWHKGRVASDETQGVYPPDTDNGIDATCKKCGGEIAVSYDEQTAKTDFVCTKCGHRISEDNLSKETKKAMREQQKRHCSASSKKLAQELARIAKILMKGN